MDQKQVGALFEAAKEGDMSAFSKLFECHWDMVYYGCLKYLQNSYDAEDAAQEVFIILRRRISNLKGPEYLASGIKYYIMEVCGNLGKKRKAGELAALPLEEVGERVFEENDEFLPEALCEKNELKQELLKQIDRLPKKQRQTLLMYYFDGFSTDAIAGITKRSASTVRTNLQQARTSLKANLDKHVQKGGAGLMIVTPVLVRVLKEDMAKVATPQVRENIWQGVEKKLNTPVKPKPLGKGFKVMIAGATVTVVVCATIAGVNIYKAVSKPQSPVEQGQAIQTEDIITAFKKVKTYDDMTSFVKAWGFSVSNSITDQQGVKYSVYRRAAEPQEIMVGYKQTPDGGFFTRYKVADKNTALPGGVEIKAWVEAIDN